MLRELRVGQLALVDEVIVPFAAGLTVLTGETGAGKSLIAGALSLLCGGRADKHMVRRGEDVAYVEGLFDLARAPQQSEFLARAGVRVGGDGILVLRREVRRQGRSRVLINGLVSSLALLERIGPRLLAVQSQDQQRELQDSTYARRLLDRMLGNEKLLAEHRAGWQAFREMANALSERRREEALAREQLDLWRYQHDELSAANLHEDEEAELAEALELKRHANSLREAAASALSHLANGQYPARDRLGEGLGALEKILSKSRRLAEVHQELLTAEEALGEATVALNRFLDGLELNPDDLAETEARQALYQDLQRKYRRSVPGLLELQILLGERIERQEAAVGDLAELEAELEETRERLIGQATRLHRKRSRSAATMAARASERIRPLALPDLELAFAIELLADPEGAGVIDGTRCRILADGPDKVTLQSRTNPGEGMGPVASIASGGETSRIFLGLTILQQRAAELPLWLFDEVDAGLGMDAAVPVAQLLQDLARRCQVVVITHLPTMAVYGQTHLCVSKQLENGRTVLQVRRLDAAARVEEVARLLGGEGWGEGDQDAQRSYALELLKTGQGARDAAVG